MQLCVYWKCMKPDISFTCKKSPCFPPVKTKETKKETKQKTLSFTILKQTYPNNQNLKKFKLKQKS